MSAEFELKGKVRHVLIRALGLDPSHLPKTIDVDSVESWDSLGHMELIDQLEAEFKIEIPHGVAISLMSEEAIIEFLEKI